MAENTTETGAKLWYREVTKGDSINAVAKTAGIHQASLNRQVASGKISPEHIVAIARAYGVNVLDALIAQGLLEPADVTASMALDALAEATDDQLVQEIARRLPDASELSPLVLPVDNVTDPGPVWGRQASTESILDGLDGEEYAANQRRDHLDDPVEP